jgi:hypothetical protein
MGDRMRATPMKRTLLGGVLAMSLFSLFGCDAFVTGESVAKFTVPVNADGSYGKVTLALGPEMNPVALNFRADYTGATPTGPRFNDYKATLMQGGQVVSTSVFTINDTGSAEAGGTRSPYALRNLMTVSVKDIGDYELQVVRTGPAHVELTKPEIELRKNIRNK